MDTMKRLLWALLAIVVAVTTLVLGLYAFEFAPGSGFSLSRNSDDWAKFGEYVGGSLGALYGLIAFVGVLITINLTREANRDAKRAHLNEQRPWIKLTVRPKVDLSYGQDGWRVVLQCEIDNLGKTPARRTALDVRVVPHLLSMVQVPPDVPEAVTWQGTDVRGELHALAESAKSANAQTAGAFGELLFGGDKLESTYGVYHSDQPFTDKLAAYNYTGQFLVLACVSYQSTLDDSWHVTAQAYSLFLDPFLGVPREHVGSLKIELVQGQFVLGNRRVTLKPASMADGYAE